MIDSYKFELTLIEGAYNDNLLLESDYTILLEWYLGIDDEENWDELIMLTFELIRMMEKKKLLDRIEKGAALIESTTDAAKLAKYTELYEALHIELLKVTEVERW